MLDLLREIVRTHHLIFTGYGGNDAALADVIAEGVRNTTNRIFWCSTSQPAPEPILFRLLGGRVRRVDVRFDELMFQVARPVLERPSLQTTEPSYLRCLFDWRLDYCNQE